MYAKQSVITDLVASCPEHGGLLTLSLAPVRALLLAALLGAAWLPAMASAQDAAAPIEEMPARVNINSADAAELSRVLSGVGEARAEAIVRYRDTYGPFETLEELSAVSGIGEATLARNRERITLE
jgi:competence protein ComEA